MLAQLNSTEEAKLDVKEIILIEGFSNSPSLRNALEKGLKKLRKDSGNYIELETIPKIKAHYYRITHPKNKGAEKAGTVILDMGELIKSDAIQFTEKDYGIKSKKEKKKNIGLTLILC
ncbi:hypothetical protein EYC80_010377 [Monilinia laxa]|uniref:Uncharacterized protein n=1 Tax=Monilinia laxa TaxID=61186 RepID=A0A5N6JNM6_MONLA|nr:hypothetical protein EYC80_010377 [Monilinia laxa]